MTLGQHIMLLHKQKELSQAVLGKAIGVLGDIIGSYKHNEISPTNEVAVKIAMAFNGTVDYLMGEGAHAPYNKETVKPIEVIENFRPYHKNCCI